MKKNGHLVFRYVYNSLFRIVVIILLITIIFSCRSLKPTSEADGYFFQKETVGIPPWQSKYERIHQPEDPDWRWNLPWDQQTFSEDNIEYTDTGVKIWARNGKQGCLYSNFYFKYGVITAKIRLPREEGAWSAFWIFGESGMPEYDVFEHCGGESHVNVTHHWGYTYDEGGKYKKSTRHNKRKNINPYDWNLYQVEVTPYKTIYRINGNVVRTMRQGAASDKRHIVLTCVWGNYCGGYTPDAFMEVEWLMVENY